MGKGLRMGIEWHGDEPPYTGKSELFKRAPALPPREPFVYVEPNRRVFEIVYNPLNGLNTCQGPVDEKGWPILKTSD